MGLGWHSICIDKEIVKLSENQMSKLLMITIELPYPPTSGGRMKSWNMLKFFTNHFDVSLVSPLKYGTSELERFHNNVDLEAFYSDAVEVPRTGVNLAKSYLKSVPLNVYRSCSEALKARVNQIADQFDVIVLDHYESFQYLPSNYKGKVILHTHNATFLMWERYANGDGGYAMRFASALEAKRVRAYERSACERADLVFASPNDIEQLSGLGVDLGKFRETYHLGDDSQLSLPSVVFKETEKRLLYVGTLSWEANVDGLVWFLEYVWPQVKAKHYDLQFDIAGGNPDKRIVDAAMDLEGVNLLGFVEDLEPLFCRSRLFMAPLRFGSGIKVKVLNTMCRGVPVVTTSVGAEGIAAEHLVHLTINDDADGMVASINQLLEDEATWNKIESESRQQIRDRYTWAKVRGYMVDEIEGLIKS